MYLKRGMVVFLQIKNLTPKFWNGWRQIPPYLAKWYIAFVQNDTSSLIKTPPHTHTHTHFSEILMSPLNRKPRYIPAVCMWIYFDMLFSVQSWRFFSLFSILWIPLLLRFILLWAIKSSYTLLYTIWRGKRGQPDTWWGQPDVYQQVVRWATWFL